jgi:hypothetical protein
MQPPFWAISRAAATKFQPEVLCDEGSEINIEDDGVS